MSRGKGLITLARESLLAAAVARDERRHQSQQCDNNPLETIATDTRAAQEASIIPEEEDTGIG